MSFTYSGFSDLHAFWVVYCGLTSVCRFVFTGSLRFYLGVVVRFRVLGYVCVCGVLWVCDFAFFFGFGVGLFKIVVSLWVSYWSI